MYKICYVLVDSGSLKYLNQLLISLKTVRNYMPRKQICVVIDDKTKANLTEKNNYISIIEKYSEVKEVEIAQEFSYKERSRYLKTNLRSLVEGDFLFLDTDTICCCEFPEKISECDIAMVHDSHIENLTYDAFVHEITNVFGDKLPILSKKYEYFNSGVMWVKDTEKAKKFFGDWNKNWLISLKNGINRDQPSLNFCNEKNDNIISKLDDVWNVQINAIKFPIQYTTKALVIHYFNMSNSVYDIRMKNNNSDIWEIENWEDIVTKPRELFVPGFYVGQDSEIGEIMSSKQFEVIKSLYFFHRKIYEKNEKILNKISNIRKRKVKTDLQ